MNWQAYEMKWCDRCAGQRPHSTNGRCLVLHRTTRLATVTPLKRAPAKPANKTKPRRSYDQTKVRAGVAALLAGEATLQQAAREVGCDLDYLHGKAWKEAKDAVSKRDDGQCQYPGCVGDRWVKDTQHRIGRGSGGTSNQLVAYYLPNLVTLCRTHHRKITDEPLHGYSLGLAIPRGIVTDPAHVPADTIHGLVLFTKDGGRQLIAPPGAPT